MPDMGFPHDRHDDSRDGASRPLPRDWREALSALPLDIPDGDGWTRLAACLPVAGANDARPDNTRRTPPLPASRSGRHAARPPVWLALAAALAVVAAIPLQRHLMSGTEDMPAPALQPAMTSAEPATTPPAVHTVPSPSAQTASAATSEDDPADGDGAVASTTRPGHRDAPGRDVAGPSTTVDPHDAAGRSAPRSDDTRLANTGRREAGSIATGTSTADIGTPDAGPVDAGPNDTAASIRDPADTVADMNRDDFERLYAESARLEALVAIARDDNMASAPTTLLTASLDERIGHIDNALSQPGLGRGQRLQLWQSRVEALHELAGVETTQRWRSARGESWDAALVQVD